MGTSTPTSITVVDTSTSSSCALKLCITAAFSGPFMRPCSRPMRLPGRRGRATSSIYAEAACMSLSPSSISGHTIYACRPAPSCRARKPYISARFLPVMAYVFTGVRPGGSSSSTEMSKSPNKSSPSVRGMGVALITSRWGLSALSASAARWRTPKRCCSSVTASPRRANCTPSPSTACVPTTSCAAPVRMASSALWRAAPFTPAVSRATEMPIGSSISANVAACCEARISVGAISTLW